MQFVQKSKPAILTQVEIITAFKYKKCGILLFTHLSTSVTNLCVHVFLLAYPKYVRDTFSINPPPLLLPQDKNPENVSNRNYELFASNSNYR